MLPTFGVLIGMRRDKGPLNLQPQMALFYQPLMIDLCEHEWNGSCLGGTEMLGEIRTAVPLNPSQIPIGLLWG
jgi:hypothetical protein